MFLEHPHKVHVYLSNCLDNNPIIGQIIKLVLLINLFLCKVQGSRGVGRILRKGGLTWGTKCRRHYGRGSRDCGGVWGSIEDHANMFLEWLVHLPFSFDSSFLVLLSFFSLFFSPPSLLFPFFLVAYAPEGCGMNSRNVISKNVEPIKLFSYPNAWKSNCMTETALK